MLHSWHRADIIWWSYDMVKCVDRTLTFCICATRDGAKWLGADKQKVDDVPISDCKCCCSDYSVYSHNDHGEKDKIVGYFVKVLQLSLDPYAYCYRVADHIKTTCSSILILKPFLFWRASALKYHATTAVSTCHVIMPEFYFINYDDDDDHHQ